MHIFHIMAPVCHFQAFCCSTETFSAQKNNNNNNNSISIHSLVPSLVRLHLGDCDRLFGWLDYMKYPLLTFVGSFNCNYFIS